MTTAPQPNKQWPPTEKTWRNIVLAVLAGVVVATAIALVPPAVEALQRTESAGTSTLSGTARVPAGERRATVALAEGVTEATVVSASVVRPDDTLVAARVVGPTTKEPQFTVVLGRPARDGGVAVQWRAAGLTGNDAGRWATEWVVVLALMTLSLVAALVAFAIAVKRRQAGADEQIDVGPELASFLKVAALLMIAALALIAVMLATDDKSLTGLFALLGTIAGYLAGNRSQTSSPNRSRGPGRDGPRGGQRSDDPDGQKDPEQESAGTENKRMRPEAMFETRSLL